MTAIHDHEEVSLALIRHRKRIHRVETIQEFFGTCDRCGVLEKRLALIELSGALEIPQ